VQLASLSSSKESRLSSSGRLEDGLPAMQQCMHAGEVSVPMTWLKTGTIILIELDYCRPRKLER
jgi:hypothetical protein